MCGRYQFGLSSSNKSNQIKEKAQKLNLVYKQGEIFPTDKVLCIIPIESKIDLSVMKWGINSKSLLINARVETIQDRPTYNAIKDNRCAVICNGFYEWDKYKNKYYISMRDRDYKWYLFVYDTEKRMWFKEDNVRAAGFANYDGSLYMCDQYQKMWVFPIESMNTYLFPGMEWDDFYYYPSEDLYPGYAVEGVYEDDIVWECETGDIGLDNPYQKYISRLIIRLQMDEDSEFYIKIMYDSSGEWEDLFNLIADCKRSYNIPLRVTRCDHFRLKFGGVGNMKLYSIAKTIETGSEL